MSTIKTVEFGVIVSDEQQFSIWPTHCRLLPGWRYSGPTGTRTEMQALVEQLFVATAPAMHIAPDHRFRDSAWPA